MNSKAQVKARLDHVVQIHVCRLPFAVNVTPNLSNNKLVQRTDSWITDDIQDK